MEIIMSSCSFVCGFCGYLNLNRLVQNKEGKKKNQITKIFHTTAFFSLFWTIVKSNHSNNIGFSDHYCWRKKKNSVDPKNRVSWELRSYFFEMSTRFQQQQQFNRSFANICVAISNQSVLCHCNNANVSNAFNVKWTFNETWHNRGSWSVWI